MSDSRYIQGGIAEAHAHALDIQQRVSAEATAVLQVSQKAADMTGWEQNAPVQDPSIVEGGALPVGGYMGGGGGGYGGMGMSVKGCLKLDLYRRFCCAPCNPCYCEIKPCALLVELIGTAILVWVGSGAVLASEGDKLCIAIAFGFTLWALIASFAPISGAHFNPSVTMLALCKQTICFSAAGAYILAQFLGALIGAALLLPLFGSSSGLGTPQIASGYGVAEAITVEIIGSFILLLYVAFAAENGANPAAAIGVGFVALEIIGVPISGGAYNFFRFLGPALLSWTFDDFWVYLVGPLVGSLAACCVYKICAYMRCTPKKHC